MKVSKIINLGLRTTVDQVVSSIGKWSENANYDDFISKNID